jgi:hypothetical protein
MAPRRAHELAVVALAALSVAAALALGRVFDGGGFVAPVLGAAVLPHAIGALTRRRGWSMAATLTLSAAAGAVYVVWAVDPAATSYGIPTPSTLETFGDHLAAGYDELRTAAVPAPVTDGALVLAVLSTWVMAQAADLLAFRRDASVAAVAPPLALFIWAATLGSNELRTRTTVVFAAAAIVFLLFQHQALLERHRAWFAGRRLGTGTGLLRAGVVAGMVAIVGGVVVGPALPGAESDALIDVKDLGGNGDGGGGEPRSYQTEPPLATIGDNFQEREERLVFTVESGQAEYWRIAALDQYTTSNGGQWTLAAEGPDEVAEGLDETKARSDTLSQRFHITSLGGRWMPAAYEAVALDGAGSLVVTASTTLVSEAETVTGLEYTVRSVVPSVPDDLPGSEDDDPLPPDVAQYTELPPDFPDEVRVRADDITSDASTPTERAAALEAFFKDPAEGFTYDLDVDLEATAQSQSAIRDFLLPENRRGFCVQFAGSYAAMARAVDLPARVAVGYTPGTRNAATGRYEVTNWNAHAWPEVYLGEQWVRFEPTPPSPDQPGGADLPATEAVGAPGDPGAATPTTVPVTAPTTAPAADTPAAPDAPVADVSIDAPGTGARGDRGFVAVSVTVVAVAVGIVVPMLLGGAVAVVVAKRRRRVRRRARPAATDAIAGAWEDTIERLAEAGVPAGAAQTPLELARAARRRLPEEAAPPLRSLAETYTAARYGVAPPDAGDAEQAWVFADAVGDALDGDVSVWVRWRRRVDPAPLRR